VTHGFSRRELSDCWKFGNQKIRADCRAATKDLLDVIDFENFFRSYSSDKR
jgi:hypothetical protein